MSFKRHDRQTFIADTCAEFTSHRIGKREFLRKMALAGIGFTGFATSMLGSTRPQRGLFGLGGDAAQAQASDEVTKWLKDVGGQFSGTTIRSPAS